MTGRSGVDGDAVDGAGAPVVDGPALTVAIVADDLIWASRLTASVERAGARPVRLASMPALETALEASALAEPTEEAMRIVGCVVDLGGRRYDGVEAVRACASAGVPVIGVGQHEDLELRRTALSAGAVRVFSYNKVFTDGEAVIARWLVEGDKGGRRSTPPAETAAVAPAGRSS